MPEISPEHSRSFALPRLALKGLSAEWPGKLFPVTCGHHHLAGCPAREVPMPVLRGTTQQYHLLRQSPDPILLLSRVPVPGSVP